MYKEDLALNNLQWLICHKKTKQTKRTDLFLPLIFNSPVLFSVFLGIGSITPIMIGATVIFVLLHFFFLCSRNYLLFTLCSLLLTVIRWSVFNSKSLLVLSSRSDSLNFIACTILNELPFLLSHVCSGCPSPFEPSSSRLVGEFFTPGLNGSFSLKPKWQ